MEDMLNEIYEELLIECEVDADDESSKKLLRIKLNNAYRECVKDIPSTYSTELKKEIALSRRGSIHNVAMFDYNQIGVEYQKSVSESGEGRSYVDRDSLFDFLPISTVI